MIDQFLTAYSLYLL